MAGLSLGLGLGTSILSGGGEGIWDTGLLTDFDSGWTLGQGVTTLTSLDNDEWLLADTDQGTVYWVDQIITVGADVGLTYALSVEARRHDTDELDILIGFEHPPATANYVEACWNLSTGALRFTEWDGTASSEMVTSESGDLGGGWRRYTISGSTGGTSGDMQIKMYTAQLTGASGAAAVVYGPGDGSGIEIRKPRFTLVPE